MTMTKKKTETTKEHVKVDLTNFQIQETQEIYRLVGTSPLIMHRLGWKAQTELLYPSPTKNRAERQTTMKHDPMKEYQSCFYKNRDDHTPTYFHMPQEAFKGAISEAAKLLPGVYKTDVEKLVQIVTPTIFVYGKPVLGADIVRQGGINKTPDVRIRPYFVEWCAEIRVRHALSMISQAAIDALVTTAGAYVGIGDWRPGKGGYRGCWRSIEEVSDPDWVRIVSTQGRDVQMAAFEKPEYRDEETGELIEWFFAERTRRTTGSKPKKTFEDGEAVPTELTEAVVAKSSSKRKRNGEGVEVA